ncbi:MAG: hypothetical protein ACRDVG_01530 [Jatrophihabitantaceae bacterium]
MGASAKRPLIMPDVRQESPVVSDEIYRVYWDDQARVAITEWAPGSVCGLAEAEAVTVAVKALGRGDVPILVDMRGMARLERPAGSTSSAIRAASTRLRCSPAPRSTG